MDFLHELPELQKVIIEIMVELLMIDKEYRFPDLLFNQDDDDETSLRLTMHYLMALLAYDFATHEDELQRGLRWFNKSYPRRNPSDIDPIEMNRLMVLLQLAPKTPHIIPRLKQLAKQRNNDFFDVQPGWEEFDTIWVIEVFLLAHKQEILTDDIITMDELRQYLDNLIANNGLKRDKDLALALRLYYENFGELSDDHQIQMNDLIQRAESDSGLWGMRELRWRIKESHWFQEFSAERKITYRDVEPQHENFRRVILSTCMVVENLIPLMNDYPQLKQPINKAVTIWYKQFEDQNVVTTLRNLFPKPHDYEYILVLCRTIRAFRTYIGERLLSLENTYLLKQITQLQPMVTESAETRNIKEALRAWIQVDITGEIERLRLGFSDANVVRIYPYIWSPLASTEDNKARSLIDDSLIIKYGPRVEVDKEREGYERLPPATQDYFVRIPQSSYTDPESDISYVVMQDLRHYKTLYEVRHKLEGNVNSLSNQLGDFLQRMHRAGTTKREMAPTSTLREIYLNKMLEYIDRVFNFLNEYELYPQDSDQADTQRIQYELFERLGQIISRQRNIEVFPSAYMHGDLHMRNIMVNGLNTVNSNNGLKFKLIDLEFMRGAGDAAFDAGQLVVDIDLVARDEQDLDCKEHLLKFMRNIEVLYTLFSQGRNDETFQTRLELAKARALLRIAKGKTKRAGKLIKNKQIAQAQAIGDELIAHTQEALDFLRVVVQDIP